MKIRTTFLALCLAGGHLAQAQEQVKVELALEREKFLANESLEVRVRVTNRSGQTLHLGKEADWLTFTISSADNRIISRLRTNRVTDAVPSPRIQESREKAFNIGRLDCRRAVAG